MKKIIKEIIIMLLAVLLSMFIFAIILYKYIPNRKVVPEVSKYVADETTEDLLSDNIDQKTNSDDVILTYEVTAGDLKGYQTTNTYVPGKSNPFAPASTSTTSSTDSGANNQNSENNGSQNGGSSNNNQSSGKTEQKNPNESTENTSPQVYQNNGTK